MKSFSIERVTAVLAKEFKQLLRDRLTYAMILVVPIVQLLLFGYAINSDPKHLPTAVLVQDQGTLPRSVLSALDHSGYFDLSQSVRSTHELDRLIAEGKVQFAITIPGDFTRRVVRGDKPQILVEADASDPAATGGAAAALAALPDTALMHDLKGPLARPQAAAQPFEVVIQRRYNPEGITAYNIVPGLLAIILSMTLVMMTALGVTREAERGTMETLLATPLRPLEVMVGKLTPYVLVGIIQASVIIVMGAAVVRRADGRRLAGADPRHLPVHRRQPVIGLPHLDPRPQPTPGDADELFLHAPVDPAVGLPVPVQGHAAMGAVDRHRDPGDSHAARGPRRDAEGRRDRRCAAEPRRAGFVRTGRRRARGEAVPDDVGLSARPRPVRRPPARRSGP